MMQLFFYTSPTVKDSDILSTCKIKRSLTLPREMLIAQQLVSPSLRNAFNIHVLTVINLSEADWNIRQAF